MKYIEVNITTTQRGKESVEAKLLACGIIGWQVIDFAEMRSFLKNNPKLWDYVDESVFEDETELVTLRTYVTDDETGEKIIETVKEAVGEIEDSATSGSLRKPTISLAKVDDENWLDNWKKYFVPFEIGEKIVICPAWEQYSNPDKIVMVVEPGSAFGTGHHESTRLSIEALERYIKHGDTMLDLGCGSGILSVIGLLLGAENCVAVDFNPNSEKITFYNVEINDISKDRLTFYTDDLFRSDSLRASIEALQYDCIVANIVADAIIPL
jgi:ribosomal protein L11 methyltransferase